MLNCSKIYEKRDSHCAAPWMTVADFSKNTFLNYRNIICNRYIKYIGTAQLFKTLQSVRVAGMGIVHDCLAV